MTDVLTDTETYGPVYAAIAHVWGERCSDYEPGCPCCDAWAKYDRLSNASAENEKLRAALERSRTVLGNMAMENKGVVFNRWPINHEPLRADAKNLLPVIDAALGGKP